VQPITIMESDVDFMHELSMAKNIIDKAQKVLKEHNAQKALAIYVKIGELSSVEKESLEFCYGVLIKGMQEFKECQLIIEQVKWVVRCNECESIYNPNEHLLRCPQCQSQDYILVSGNELDFVGMEVE